MPREKMAGVEGVEPSHTVPETAVLPLDDTPITMQLRMHLIALARVVILVARRRFVKRIFRKILYFMTFAMEFCCNLRDFLWKYRTRRILLLG